MIPATPLSGSTITNTAVTAPATTETATTTETTTEATTETTEATTESTDTSTDSTMANDDQADMGEEMDMAAGNGLEGTVMNFDGTARTFGLNENDKNYTVNNNVNATHNLLTAIVESGQDIHVVHLGTMGVYGYGTAGMKIPEGYLDVEIPHEEQEPIQQQILYPTNPGSIYHMTKCLDQLIFQFYAKNDNLRITDLHQGIVWGTHTDQTRRHPQLVNRFDYDGDYGTVLNRFLIQAAIGYPLTVHGTGGQTRAFIHIQDSVRCIELALKNPPARGDRVKIFNQMTETHRVRDLAEMIARMTGAKIAFLPNPRKEAAENELVVKNEQFLALGLEPITLAEGLLEEVVDVAKKFAYRVDRSRVPAVSAWTKDIAKTVEADPEGKRLKSVS